MFSDIVIPKNNKESEFIEIGLRLGIKKIYFLYNYGEHGIEELQAKSKLGEIHKNMSVEYGFIVNEKNINNALKETRLIVSKSSDLDKFFIESQKIRLIYGFEDTDKRDSLHQRAAGLNHTLCELAKKNNIAIGFSYGSLFGKGAQTTSILLGRMMQNIKLCQKYKVQTKIASFSEDPFGIRLPHDVISLFTILGMDRNKAKESLTIDI
ncbi:MAG: RNase P subunit p30 family protein [Nanoarchaeota archaeon]